MERFEAEAAARLAQMRHTHPAGAAPASVWDDAQRQLAGMLGGLAELTGAVPMFGDPLGGSPNPLNEGRGGGGPTPLGEGRGEGDSLSQGERAGVRAAAHLDRSPHALGRASPELAEGLGASSSPLPGREGASLVESEAPGPFGRGLATGRGARADLCALSLLDLAGKLRRREVSPVEVTRAVLDRIAAYDAALCTFVTVTAEQALEGARAAEREIGAGRYRGPLHGVPVAAKDLFATRGVPTTGGSAILRDWVPDADAAAVAAWRAAGAILIGKNTLHEFAFGGTSVNAHTGTPRNPWNPDHMCGGSSGGSAAAVAAGFAFGALGSETGNSVRRPAAFCGVVGLKPTFGRVSRRGVLPLAWTLDHVGVFARTPADAAALVAPLAGFDPADPGSRRPPPGGGGEADPAALAPVPDLRGRRAGVPRAWLADALAPDVERAFERALAALRDTGVEVRDVDLPLAGRWAALVSSVTMHAEAAAVHAGWVDARPHDYGHDVLARLLAGRALAAGEYARAQAMRGAVTAELLDALREVDVLVAPATPAPAPPLQAGAYVPGDAPWSTQPGAFQLQRLFSLTGLPAASAPAGLDAGGLPIGVQIAARPWDEGLVLGVAAAVMASVPAAGVPPLRRGEGARQ